MSVGQMDFGFNLVDVRIIQDQATRHTATTLILIWIIRVEKLQTDNIGDCFAGEFASFTVA